MAILDKYGNSVTAGNAGKGRGRAYSPQRASAARISQGAGQVLLGKGGLGYIARRGVDFGTSVAVQTLEGVARLAIQQPLELLSLLPDLVPEFRFALGALTSLGSGPGSLRIKAMTKTASGGSEEAPDGTAAIADLWKNNSKEVGGLLDALGQNLQMLAMAGMCACEAVPGPRNRGVAGVFPINTLTLRFKRDNDGSLNLYQRQTANPNGLGLYSAGFGGMFEPMPMNRVFYNRLPGLPDEPYGRAHFGAALTVVLEILAFWRDVMTAFHRVGTPKFDVGIDYEYWGVMATTIVGLTDPKEINDYIGAKQDEMVAFYNDLKPDDVFFHGIKDKVGSVGSGDNWPDISALWSMLRLRLIQALMTLPAMMGVMDSGGGDMWSKMQFKVYANSLVNLMDKAASPLVEASQLHLRLLGMPYTAEAEMQNTETITRLIDAQAEAIEISNEVAKVQQNWQLNDTAAMTITGSAPPDEASRAGDTEAKPLPVAALPAGKPGDVPTKEDNVQGDPKPRDGQQKEGAE